MKNSDFTVNTKLGIFDYIVLVDNMAEEYFDDKGNYQPHYGSLNAMRLFYNYCVAPNSKDALAIIDLEHLSDLADVVADPEFIKAFVTATMDITPVTFGCAYADVKKIVEQKNSFAGTISSIVNSIKELSDALPEISGMVNNPEKAYAESDKFKELTGQVINIADAKG